MPEALGMQKRPARLRIGPFTWKVLWSAEEVLRLCPEGDADGVCDQRSLTIAVDPGESEDYARNTALHETLHACVAASSPQGMDEHEEAFVAAVTAPLLGLLRDNKQFARWLIEA